MQTSHVFPVIWFIIIRTVGTRDPIWSLKENGHWEITLKVGAGATGKRIRIPGNKKYTFVCKHKKKLAELTRPLRLTLLPRTRFLQRWRDTLRFLLGQLWQQESRRKSIYLSLVRFLYDILYILTVFQWFRNLRIIDIPVISTVSLRYTLHFNGVSTAGFYENIDIPVIIKSFSSIYFTF